ncbi:PIG-L family deacetylase [Streptomyces rhizosphaerihabitans]|uniref:PIG-L family deacetylase n=1 Tax=Streptomyces rhizosphaerihabitans TaxID=1266770 RepID=UPI0021BF49FD|nr:PIG-L family deacetylase [Streptomyces rhizosphaerihabitans]MCT9006021.1 PIG-L family deacetylase [Streptomyces rhizosphaerihabitans]
MNSPASVLQIMAHPDDDLYFVNPAVVQGLNAGTPTTTVYLTSGDSDGRNHRPWQSGPATEEVTENRADYAKARQNGIKAAYAAMALGDRTAEWKDTTLTTVAGPVAEIYSLADAPWVKLIFLNIRQHGTPEGPPRSLHVLWREETERVPTLVVSGGVVHEQNWYNRAGLVETLAQIMGIVRPTVIRTMDPDPDRLVHNERFPQRHDYGDLSDHCDHTAAALFSWLAVARHQATVEKQTFVVEAFRGYYNERWPHNLGVRSVSQKELFLNLYAAADGYDCGDPAGSGDYSVGLGARLTGWVQSTAPRHPAGVNWLLTDPTGRLTAFAVVNQQAAVWMEAQPGSGQWRGPFFLGGGPLAPGLAVCLTPDGRWQIFAERMSLLAVDDAQRREIVLLEQAEPGGAFRSWTPLGNPSAGSRTRDRHLGAPVVARDGAGRLHLFVRNAGQGLHTRIQMPDGTWSGWTDLRGHELQEGLAAVTAANGHVDVFGASRGAVFRWAHKSLNEPLTRAPRFRLAPSAGPVAAVLQPSGQVMTVYREPDTGHLLMAQEDDPGGRWAQPAESVGGRGGYGAVALAAGPSPEAGTLVACRSNLGAVAYRFLPGDPDQPWQELPTTSLGGTFTGAPAAAFDAQGRATIAVIGADAKLAVARQTVPEAAEFGAWTIVG